MARYVDGFVLPIAKKNLAAYRRLARKAAKVWRDHGALEYRECVGEDLKVKGPSLPAPRPVPARRDGGVRVDRLPVRARTGTASTPRSMNDPRLAGMDLKSMPFDVKRLAYGGFAILVDALRPPRAHSQRKAATGSDAGRAQGGAQGGGEAGEGEGGEGGSERHRVSGGDAEEHSPQAARGEEDTAIPKAGRGPPGGARRRRRAARSGRGQRRGRGGRPAPNALGHRVRDHAVIPTTVRTAPGGQTPREGSGRNRRGARSAARASSRSSRARRAAPGRAPPPPSADEGDEAVGSPLPRTARSASHTG